MSVSLMAMLVLIPRQMNWAYEAGSFVLMILVVFIIYRTFAIPLLTHFGDRGQDDTHGSARFGSEAEATPLMRATSGLLIGRGGKRLEMLRYNGPAHLLTMAPTRSGKGVGTLIPNLLVLERSVICIDPKGENAKITARARSKFGPVYVLDPFGISNLPSAAYNPMDGIDPDNLDVAEDAATLADALVYDEPGQGGDAHWNEEAKALITGLILLVTAQEPKERRSLATLREYLTLAPQAFKALLETMQKSTACNGLIARAANRQLGKSDKEATGVLSAAQRHTHFLDSPRMTMIGSPFLKYPPLRHPHSAPF